MLGFHLNSGAGVALAVGTTESLRAASLDAHYTDGAKVDTATAIKVGTDAGADCQALFIFPITDIPQASVITEATVRLKRVAGTQTAISVVWKGYDVDNATALAADEATFTGLARTTATVSQDIAAGAEGDTVDSPALTTIVQEIVDRPGFGGNIGIILDKGAPDWGLANFAAAEHTTALEAILAVKY